MRDQIPEMKTASTAEGPTRTYCRLIAALNARMPRVLTSLVLASMVATAAIALLLTPTTTLPNTGEPLANAIPSRFGDWQEIRSPLMQVNLTQYRAGETTSNQPYDDVLMRSYQNSAGDVVMLAIAYGRNQRQEVKIHRPDLCYIAQGFDVMSNKPTSIPAISSNSRPITTMRMIASRPGRLEAVSYWMRVGRIFSEDSFSTRAHIFTEGLAGRIPDGVVGRASKVISGEHESELTFRTLEQFLAEMIKAVAVSNRSVLI